MLSHILTLAARWKEQTEERRCRRFPSLGITTLKNLHPALFVFAAAPTFCCDPAWIHIECDCIHQHLPSSTLVWLRVFNLLKCTLTLFFSFFLPPWHWECGTGLEFEDQTPVDRDTHSTSSCLIDATTLSLLTCFLLLAYLPLWVYTGIVIWATAETPGY